MCAKTRFYGMHKKIVALECTGTGKAESLFVIFNFQRFSVKYVLKNTPVSKIKTTK